MQLVCCVFTKPPKQYILESDGHQTQYLKGSPVNLCIHGIYTQSYNWTIAIRCKSKDNEELFILNSVSGKIKEI